jgi:glycosyltransferase involved in cell wall biosynthesis
MQSLLFITPELPYPAQSGGKLKSLNLLKHLASCYHVTLACPLKREDAQHLDGFMQVLGNQLALCLTTPVNVPRNALNMTRSYLRNEPLNVLRTRGAQLKQRIDALPTTFDCVYLDHYEVFQYLPTQHTGKVVYHAHNAYFRLWQRYAEICANPLFKLVAHMEAQRVKRYERRVCRRADLVFAAPDDIKALAEAGCDASIMQETYHLGDDTQMTLPAMQWQDTAKRLVYVGFLGWEANVLGLTWFLDDIWPQLKAAHPDLALDIVGKHPDDRLQTRAARDESIRLLGYVADLETVYPGARVCIAPLTFGSGMKVKVLNAMARGIPVATTRIGAESIEVEHGRHLMIATTAQDMIEDISQLLIDPVLWQRLADESRQRIAEKYTWQALFTAMDQALSSVLNPASANQSTPASNELTQTQQVARDAAGWSRA